MFSPKKDGDEGVSSVSHDRDASTRRALDRLIQENQRLKALVVSLSALIIKNVVGTDANKDKPDASSAD